MAGRHEPAPAPPDGRRAAQDALYAAVYDELRRVAAAELRRESRAALSPTTLVHEVWLKLARAPLPAGASAPDVMRLARYLMRQVLVDAARKRVEGGDGASALVTLDEGVADAAGQQAMLTSLDVIDLHAALHALEQAAPRQARLVELRYFGGFTMPESAAELGVSLATAERDWWAARAWLGLALERARGGRR